MAWSLLILIVMTFLNGCAAFPSEPVASILLQVDDVKTGPLQTRPVILELNGKPVLLYATKNDRTAFRVGEKVQLLDETARVKQGASYFQLHRLNQELTAMWWSHQDGKNLYFTRSEDGGESFSRVSMVNDDHGVLPPYSVMRGPGGVVGVTYHDERLPNYQMYFNRSDDKGLTWTTPDRRLDDPPPHNRSSDVHEPQTVELGSVWFSAWTDKIQDGNQAVYRIVSRRSADAGLTWESPSVLFKSDRHISTLNLRANEHGIVVVADELERGIFALASLDNGKNWGKAGLLAGSDKVSNSGINMVLAGDRAHLVWMQERKEEKTRIMRASLDISQVKWLDSVQRLDMKSPDNTRSTSPVITATTNGVVATAWIDFRDIRPNVYLSASYDGGLTWQYPKALLKPGEASMGWPQLLPWGDQLAIAYEIYPGDTLADGRFIVRQISVGDSASGIQGIPNYLPISEERRKERLNSRIETLWSARLKADYATAYDIFDFAYKAATSKKSYIDNVGVIDYLNYAVSSYEIVGNVADVQMKVKYEVKPTILPMTGKPISVKPIEVDSPSKWVWVGDDWYLVYTPSFDQPLLRY